MQLSTFWKFLGRVDAPTVRRTGQPGLTLDTQPCRSNRSSWVYSGTKILWQGGDSDSLAHIVNLLLLICLGKIFGSLPNMSLRYSLLTCRMRQWHYPRSRPKAWGYGPGLTSLSPLT